ncbi:STAS domain-containing protein [Vibrio makurazakiensis]|uniref:STAS domain-containing protein n=1 Tax=Vibrio makurazakiensis TaxID=2910250 RepID=UPI003D0EB651
MIEPSIREEYLLPAELTIYEVGEIYADLLERVGQNKSLNVDASRLQDIDTAGIQLLVRFMNMYPHQQFQIINASLVLTQAFEFLGVVWGVELSDE